MFWVLNNEGEDMMHWGGGDPPGLMDQYITFYIDNLLPVLEDAGITIETEFMDTSPSNGVKSFDPYVKYISGSPQSASRGDSHFYYLTSDCEKDSTHTWPRF